MKTGAHLDLDKIQGQPQYGALSERDRRHLEDCPKCRKMHQLQSQAERLLGNQPDEPSQLRSEAILNAVLDNVEPAPERRWLSLRYLVPALAGAGLLLLLVLWRQPTSEHFAHRGPELTEAMGLRAYCYNNSKATPLTPEGICPSGALLGASLYTDRAQRVFLFLLDPQRQLHPASYQNPDHARQGLPVGGPQHDEVLDAWLSLEQMEQGQAFVVAAICPDCDSTAAERAVRRCMMQQRPQVQCDGVLLQQIPVTIARQP